MLGTLRAYPKSDVWFVLVPFAVFRKDFQVHSSRDANFHRMCMWSRSNQGAFVDK